jgi:RNA-directed DNA polymerase
MDLWSPHSYLGAGLAHGYPEPVLKEALLQANTLQRQNLPAILTLKHLSVLTEVGYKDLQSYVEREIDPYRVFSIRKRAGGRRVICVPDNSLVRVHRWLSRYVLNTVKPHRASMAYAPGSSPVRCAKLHSGCEWLIKIDVSRFFESISEIQVYTVYKNLGYNPLISFEMARLCTRIYEGRNRRIRTKVWTRRESRDYWIPNYLSTQIGHLPQGAPTSPMLANLAMKDLDEEIASIAGDNGLVYTRYADDITLSGRSTSFSRQTAERVVTHINRQLRSNGLLPNKRKTMIAPPGARKIVLGLLVDGPSPRLQRQFKQNLLSHAYYLKKFGPASHAKTRGFNSLWAMQRHLVGLLNYARMIEPEFARKASESFDGHLEAIARSEPMPRQE